MSVTVHTQAELDQALAESADVIYVDSPYGVWLRISATGCIFCAHPQLALDYKKDATNFVKCGVRLDEIVCLDDKIKARRVVVACVEVDRYGRVVEAVK